MIMFRALSTRRGGAGYERLAAEPLTGGAVSEPQLARDRSVSAAIFGFPKKPAGKEAGSPTADSDSPAKKSGKTGKSHPVFSLFGRRKSKKMTAKAEFGRYVEYLKEGGRWDEDTNTPVIYYNKK